jgi:RNA polymerase sigma factor (sigma-70 family)
MTSPAPPSFEALLAPHVDRLYRLAFRLTNNRADAEDLVQEVLVKAYERHAELTSIEALGPWLGRVLYNRFVDDSRRYARTRLKVVPLDATAELPDSSAAPTGEPHADAAFDIITLNEALGKLSLEHRSVLMMHDAEGYKLPEIQLITGIPIGTLKSRLHRARARLRELLEKTGTF